MTSQKYSITIATLICIAILCTGTVSAQEIMVGSGYGNTTITAALANASNGDIITVTDGIYTENVDVTKEVTIRSENGAASTIIFPSLSDHVFYVNAYDVTISGFTIACSYGNAGIYLSSSSNITLTNNTIIDNYDGIYLSSSSNITLTNNTVSDNMHYGIYLYSSSSSTLTNNNASDNIYGIYLISSDSNSLTNNTASDNSNSGICLSGSTGNTLTGNIMSQNDYNLYISSNTLTYRLNDIDTSNLVNSKPVYYLINSSDDVVPSNAGIVYATNCSNVSVQDINIVSELYGVNFYQTDNSTIENATISECLYGIYLYSGSDSNNLTNNTVSNTNYRGIYLYYSDSNNLTNNTVSNTNYEGIYLSSSASNNLTNNTVSNNNDDGIYLSHSASNTLANNTANSNTYDGIYLSSSASNTLTNNNASDNNDHGIYLSSSDSNTLTNNNASDNNDYGIYLTSSSYGNTLMNNTANNNYRGIYLFGSGSNNLTNNTASNNDYYGLYLSSSASNTLVDNQVDNNTNYDLRLFLSTNNIINPLILGDDLAELIFTSSSSTVEILRNETNANEFSGKTNINGYIEINSVLSSMDMSLFYNDTEMSSAEEATIALYKLDGTEWAEVQNTILDTSNNTLSVSLTEFGTFALFNGLEPTTTTTTSSSSGTRASVSQGQDPAIVSTSASSVKRIIAGAEVNYDFSDSGTPVLGVSFDAKNDEGLVVAKVQVLSSAPEGVPTPSGNSYQMMSIDVGSEGTISSDSADNVIISFKVNKQWIEENNIDVSTIRMTRYHGEQWNNLPTSQESEDGEYFYFYAETPGFSVFNVVGDEIGASFEQVPTSAASVEEADPVEEEETSSTPGFTALAGIVVVSLAFLVSRKYKYE